MRTANCAMAVVLLLLAGGCGSMNPDLRALGQYGGTGVRDVPRSVTFAGRQVDDDRFAQAWVYLDRYGVRDLDLSGCNITDDSVSLMMQLDRLEKLSLQGTKITPAGLMRLHNLPRLRLLVIEPGMLSDTQRQDLQAALRGTRLQEKPYARLEPQH